MRGDAIEASIGAQADVTAASNIEVRARVDQDYENRAIGGSLSPLFTASLGAAFSDLTSRVSAEIDGGSVGVTGLVCELGQETVFVKMTGPMEALRAQRDRFVALCKSLSRP